MNLCLKSSLPKHQDYSVNITPLGIISDAKSFLLHSSLQHKKQITERRIHLTEQHAEFVMKHFSYTEQPQLLTQTSSILHDFLFLRSRCKVVGPACDKHDILYWKPWLMVDTTGFKPINQRQWHLRQNAWDLNDWHLFKHNHSSGTL